MDLVRSDFLPNPYFRKKIQKKNKKCNNLIESMQCETLSAQLEYLNEIKN